MNQHERMLDHLQRAYQRSEASVGTGAGTGVVGYVGTTVPLELICAARFHPFRLAAYPPHPVTAGDAFMEQELGWEQRSIFDGILSGRYPPVDLLVIDRSFTALFLYLKEVVRIGAGVAIPPLYMFDFIPSAEPSVQRYNAERVGDLIRVLVRRAGAPIAPSGWRKAVVSGNRRRELLRTLAVYRQRRLLTGALALAIIGAGYFMPPSAYVDCLSSALFALSQRAAGRGPRLLVLSSEALYHPRLHEILEQVGGIVVAEDDWWGSRAACSPISDDLPLAEAVLEMCSRDAAGVDVHPADARLRWLTLQLAQSGETGVEALIVYMPPSDHMFGWDYPRIRSLADRAHVPHLVIRSDVLAPNGAESVRAAAAAFIADLPTGQA